MVSMHLNQHTATQSEQMQVFPQMSDVRVKSHMPSIQVTTGLQVCCWADVLKQFWGGSAVT